MPFEWQCSWSRWSTGVCVLAQPSSCMCSSYNFLESHVRHLLLSNYIAGDTLCTISLSLPYFSFLLAVQALSGDPWCLMTLIAKRKKKGSTLRKNIWSLRMLLPCAPFSLISGIFWRMNKQSKITTWLEERFTWFSLKSADLCFQMAVHWIYCSE